MSLSVQFLDELRALADQRVAAARERIVNRARNRKHLAAVVERTACRDQRAAAPRRLHDQRAERKPGDDAIASRKVRPSDRGTDGDLGHQRAPIRPVHERHEISFERAFVLRHPRREIDGRLADEDRA